MREPDDQVPDFFPERLGHLPAEEREEANRRFAAYLDAVLEIAKDLVDADSTGTTTAPHTADVPDQTL